MVIVNANARRFVEARSLLLDVDRLVEGRAELHVTRTREELARAADASRGARAVVLCGGDGSYSAGATELARAFGDAPLPMLAFAPGGTVGTVPRALGLATSGPVIEGIARLLHAAASDRPRTIETPTLRIRSENDARISESIGFIFGTGLVARFFELYDTRAAEAARSGAVDLPSGGAGIGPAAKIVARVFAESFYGGPFARQVLDPLRCDVEIDGVPLPWKGSSLVVSSVLRDLGLGMRVTWRGGEDPERPHVVVSGLSPRALGPRLTRVLRGKPIGAPPEPHFDGLAKRFSVSFPDGPGPWVVDGDLRLARRVEVSGGPKLRLISLENVRTK